MITPAIIQNIATIIYFISTCVCVYLGIKEKHLWGYLDREYLFYITPILGAFMCWMGYDAFKDIEYAIAPAQHLFLLCYFVLIFGSISNAITFLITYIEDKKYSKNKNKSRK